MYTCMLYVYMHVICIHAFYYFQCRKILKLTSSMMSPENFSVVDPVNLVAVTLSPREDTGLVSFLSLALTHTQTHTYLCTEAHTLTYVQKHTHLPMYRSTHTYLCTEAHTLTYVQKHTHTEVYPIL